jgi:hypothetical protein
VTVGLTFPGFCLAKFLKHQNLFVDNIRQQGPLT